MLSPLELENKRILTNKRRYDRYEMDEYLDMVFENYKELFNAYEEQKKQIKTLSEGIQYYRSIESTMQKALLLAEKTSKETKDAAILKAEAIEKDANNKAAKILGTAEQEYTRIREKCIELVTQFNNYKAQLQIAANEQLKLITSTTFDIETPEIDKQEDVKASGLESVDAMSAVKEPYVANVEPVQPDTIAPVEPVASQPEPVAPQPEPVAPQLEPFAPMESFASVQQESVQPESFVQMEAEAAPVEPVAQQEAEPASVESFAQTQEDQSTQFTTIGEPEATVAPETSVGMETVVPTGMDAVVEERPKSNVYSYSATGNTNPLPNLSGDIYKSPETAQQEQDISSQFEMYTETPVAATQPEPVSEKTMILPDVKKADRESLRVSKTYSEEEQLQILSAETINLGDSIKAVKEKEMLEVPQRDETEQIVLEPGVTETPVSGQPKTGLDTILQSMTIGKKKKANGESAEDPFEFLGSVDDF